MTYNVFGGTLSPTLIIKSATGKFLKWPMAWKRLDSTGLIVRYAVETSLINLQ